MKPRLTWTHTRSGWDSKACGCSSYASGRLGRRLAQAMRCKRRAALDTSQTLKVWLPYIAITLALRCSHQNHVVYPVAWRKELGGLIRWRRHDMTICFFVLCFILCRSGQFMSISVWYVFIIFHICLSIPGSGLGNYDQTTCTQLIKFESLTGIRRNNQKTWLRPFQLLWTRLCRSYPACVAIKQWNIAKYWACSIIY